jgi:hypothetical protein
MATSTIERSTNQALLQRGGRMFINRQWEEARSGRRFDVLDPASGDVLTQVAEADKVDVELAVAAAHAAFDGGEWSRLTASDRSPLLWRVADLLERDPDAFARLETMDNGKPLSMSRGDVGLAIDMFRYMAGWATKIVGETMDLSLPFAHHSFTSSEPIGVAAQIVPWNFPLLMAAWKVTPALAAGCTINAAISTPRPTGGNIVVPGSAKGNYMPRAPKFTLNAGASYAVDTASGGINLAANYFYNDGYYWDASNSLRGRQKSYSRVNGTAKWTAPDKKFDVTLWAKDIPATRYYSLVSIESATGDVAAPAPPRTFGATVAVHI